MMYFNTKFKELLWFICIHNLKYHEQLTWKNNSPNLTSLYKYNSMLNCPEDNIFIRSFCKQISQYVMVWRSQEHCIVMA